MDKELLQKGVDLVVDKTLEMGYSLLYLALSGSHAWGLERSDSDIDFRGVYQKPTMDILGLHKGRDTIEMSEGIYDVQLYEIEKFLNMLCKHNGNMVNLLWLSHPLVCSLTIPWVGLSRAFVTKKLRFYYRGYAEGQRKRAMSCRGGKALLYTYREMFSGLWVMRHGYLEHNFRKLWDEAIKQGWYQGSLLNYYFPDCNKEITDEGWRAFYSEWEQLCVALDEESEKSALPDGYDGVERCSALLRQVRLYNLFEQVMT